MNANEIWKPVVGYEGLYSVSSKGGIRREDKISVHKTGVIQKLSAKLMKPTCGKSLYQSVRLSKDKLVSTLYIHHLVLSAFVGPMPLGMEACHGDGNRQNNAIGNLRWDTKSANLADKRLHGTANTGEQHKFAKLTNESVMRLRTRRQEGASITTLANEFSVSRMTASRAASHKSWSHI